MHRATLSAPRCCNKTLGELKVEGDAVGGGAGVRCNKTLGELKVQVRNNENTEPTNVAIRL